MGNNFHCLEPNLRQTMQIKRLGQQQLPVLMLKCQIHDGTPQKANDELGVMSN